MTGPELREARARLTLSQAQLAAILGYGAQTRISEMEARDEVPGAVALAVRAMLAFGPPDGWPEQSA